MRWSFATSVAVALAVPFFTTPVETRANSVPAQLAAGAGTVQAQVQPKMPGGVAAQARTDADAAAKAGEFGLIEIGIDELEPAGVLCFTPLKKAPDTLFSYPHGDVITPDVSARIGYAVAYNRALVERPDYPHAELCRAATADELAIDMDDPQLLTKPAREIDVPPRDLFESARRGSADDVRRFLKNGEIDAYDAVKMTALAWAVARNNRPAIDALLAAGADPWKSEAYPPVSAVYIAAALGRWPDFQRLANRGSPPFGERGWNASYLRAAIIGGNLSILNHMLSQPNAGVQIELLGGRRELRAELFEAVLDKQPQLANRLLIKAVSGYPPRADLVRVALAHGADANARERSVSDTALTMAANGIYPDTVEIVRMLLEAGADPNAMSHRRRPVWAAIGTLTLDPDVGEVDQRAKAIFEMLIAAGADLRLPDDTGRPPIWFKLFPYRPVSEVLDASYVTPELLEMLVQNGLDVNAEWNGKRVLGLVEAQAGRESELARTLRRLGAVR